VTTSKLAQIESVKKRIVNK